MRVLDVPDGQFKRKVFEGVVGADLVEGGFERGRGGIGFKRMQDTATGGFREGRGKVGGAGAGEEGDSEVAMRRGRENTCDAGGGCGACAEEDGEAVGFGGHDVDGWVDCAGKCKRSCGKVGLCASETLFKNRDVDVGGTRTKEIR